MIKRFFYIFSATLFIMLSASTGVNAEVMEKKMEALERNLNSPPGFNYQAVLRNSDGTVMASKSVTLRFTISNADGNLWEETHSKTTDAFGAVVAVIGEGTKTGGSASAFAVIDWGASDASVKVEVDTGNGFVNLGTSELSSVPYAKFADNGLSVADRTKLNNIVDGAEANVQVDWDQTNDTADDYILNKPTIPTDINQLSDEDGLLNGSTFDGSFESLSDVPSNLDTDATDDFSGDYNDLTNQPSIPTAIDDLADGSGNATLSGVFTANELAVAGAFNLPTADGTNGQFLTTDGAGNASWADAVGADYSGSGSYSFQISGPTATPNSVYSNFGAIGGGRNNVIQLDGAGNYHSEDAVIGGGYGNMIEYSAAKTVIAGGSGNSIETYSDHAVISGGSNNTISESYKSTISGGASNELSQAYYSAIGGGYENTISSNYGSVSGGRSNSINSGSDYSTIGGGYSNTVSFSSSSSTIAGGYSNYVRSQKAFIGGGNSNEIADNSNLATIGGGYDNRVREASVGGTVAGGYYNVVRFGSTYGFVGGGRSNSVNASPYGVVAGGYENGVQTNSNHGAIGGGYSNSISNSYNATIAGGYQNLVRDSQSGTVAGGRYNYVTNSSSAFIGGGQSNRVGTSSYKGTQSSIVGGRNNTVNAYWSTIGGGDGNTINEQVGANPLAAAHNTIAGGKNNTIGGTYDARDAFIGGGYQNIVNARSAATVGGWGLETSSFGATALGFYNATTGGTPSSAVATDALFVVGNGTDDMNRSDAFVMLKDGSSTMNGNLQVNGDLAYSGTLSNSSDERLKTDIRDVQDVLNTLVKLEGYKYRYNNIKASDTESEHYGVIAQEVQKLYPELVKEGEDGYLSVDYMGLIPLLLEAVKELNQQNQTLMAENDQLEKSNLDLEARQSNDEARFADLENKINKLMMLVAPVDVAYND